MPIGIIFISILFMVLGMIVQYRLKSKFSAYSKVPTVSGLSGKEVAEKMLHDNGIFDVTCTSVPGFLSDHYDPAKKTVNLSPDVYEGETFLLPRWLRMNAVMLFSMQRLIQCSAFRSALVPVVQISSNLAQWIILIGLGLFQFWRR